jgi:cephalosporin-C deacetylase-like acetyl esterase
MRYKRSFWIPCLLCLVSALNAQSRVPPYDLWNPQVLSQIRDRSTLELSTALHLGYSDVFFTSNPSASWFESVPPYAEHRNERIRIHGFLASPLVGGPYPALVLGHGHGGRADRDTALLVASLGYVALFIDGPEAGESTGGPEDENQAWISVDRGPQYGYLYHYAYAGMRALTALESLAALPGNPFRIDAARLGVVGASMGGIMATYLNGIDDRVKAAVIVASAGNWHHALRYPDSWLYHGIYTGTRDLPYNGSDPLNSIENIDTDATAVTFLNYFDPIRYAPRQHAPVFTVIGTHDQYFPLPSANLTEQAITSAGTQANFEKRLWLLPNTPHGFGEAADLLPLASGLRQWLDYAFGRRDRPLAAPQVTPFPFQEGGGLRFEITVAESAARLSGAQATLYAATRVDSTIAPIRDFKAYSAVRQGDRFVAQIPPGEASSSGDIIQIGNVIFYATITDALGLPVSSLMYKGRATMDLSSGFTPKLDPFSGNSSAPLPPPPSDAAVKVLSSIPVSESAFKGVALSNTTDNTLTVRVEARSLDGRIAAGEGLMNPAFVTLAPRSQNVFLAEELLGPGARRFDGSFQAAWSETRTSLLAFRASAIPSVLESIGPLPAPAVDLWLPLAPEHESAASRIIRIFCSVSAASAEVVFRNRFGTAVQTRLVAVAANGTVDVVPPAGSGFFEPASAEVLSSAPVSARLDVAGAGDSWSLDARPAPSLTRYVQPHVEWNGAFRTRLIFVNPSAETRSVALQLRSADGVVAAPNPLLVMMGFSTASLTVEQLFGGIQPTRGAGWLEANALGGPVLIYALAVDPNSGGAAASLLESSRPGLWSMPFFVEHSGYFTGLALANPGDTAAAVAITAYDGAGVVLGAANITLGARQAQTRLVSQWLPELRPGASGHILISSDSAAVPLAYFGTTDGATLAALPLQPVAPR